MSTLTRFAVSGVLAIAGTVTATAQESRTEVPCSDDWFAGGRASVHICEQREFTLAAAESLQVNGRPNGSVDVTGWDRNEIQVRAIVRSWSRDEDAARDRLAQIEIATDGAIRAHGPQVRNSWWPFGRRDDGGWNVNFEIMAPRDTDLWTESVNGRIVVADMRGNVDAETVNGGIDFANLSSAARGRTVNGGISAQFADSAFEGDIVDLRTTNGGVVMRIPEDFSARLDVETVNGGVNSDFPVTREGRGNREVSATWGSGGPLIRARTVNGGVQIRQF